MMMHPDEIEEMDYACNAHYDYLREAYGPTAQDADSFCEDEYDWNSERGCYNSDIPWVNEGREDSHVHECVKSFLWEACNLVRDPNEIPF
jgi:hypothetical protein